MGRSGRLAFHLGLAAATVLVFDLVAWFTVPDEFVGFAHSYRKVHLLSGPIRSSELVGHHLRNYFRADDVLGFDLAPGARATHVFDTPGRALPVFANDLGCFDRNDAAAFRGKPYHYFAGDSFTWGFADYEDKFATVWERMTAKLAAKCGVPHTGQVHQFEKFKRFAAAVGSVPATVFVGFVVNDPANDWAHPHTTVVDGYYVDMAFLRDGAIVHPDIGEVRRAAEESLREADVPVDALDRLKTSVWVLSLSANIVNEGLRSAFGQVRPTAPTRPSEKFGENFYLGYNPIALKTLYTTDPRTEANREVIANWAAHARAHGYRLVFVLFPLKEAFDDTTLFAQVRSFLDANGIENLDLSALFKAERLAVHDLYWTLDGHWHAKGNRVVARLLAERY